MRVIAHWGVRTPLESLHLTVPRGKEKISCRTGEPKLRQRPHAGPTLHQRSYVPQRGLVVGGKEVASLSRSLVSEEWRRPGSQTSSLLRLITPRNITGNFCLAEAYFPELIQC